MLELGSLAITEKSAIRKLRFYKCRDPPVVTRDPPAAAKTMGAAQAHLLVPPQPHHRRLL